MKWYIASRTRYREKVSSVVGRLRRAGHEVDLDWTEISGLRPYEEDVLRSGVVSRDMLRAAMLSDVFVILSDGGGRGMYVEFGAALAAYEQGVVKNVYVVGDHASNSVFYFHPVVRRVESIDEVLVQEGVL